MIKKLLNRKRREREEAPEDQLGIVVDFSKAAIKKAVNSEINQYPVTLFSGVGAVVSALYMVLISFTPLSFLFCLGLTLVCAASFIVNKFFMQNSYEINYVEKMREAMRRQRELAIKKLGRELDRFDCPEGVNQIELLREKYESLVSVIDRKVPEEGLVHSRFLGMAEQVYKNGLDNLQQVVTCLDSISPIDPKRINQQINSLKAKLEGNPSLQKNIDILENTLKMRDSRLQEIENLLHENIGAMAKLDQTAMEISQMDFSKEQVATIDMEQAMYELVHLAETFKGYGKKEATDFGT